MESKDDEDQVIDVVNNTYEPLVLSDYEDDISAGSLSDISCMEDPNWSDINPKATDNEDPSHQKTANYCRMFEQTFLNTCKFPNYLKIKVLRGIAKGVISTKHIRTNELISFYDGERIYESGDFTEMEHYLEISSVTHTFWINGTNDVSGVAKYFREDKMHPNMSLGWGMCADKYYPVFYALRNINSGEELVYTHEGQTDVYSWKVMSRYGMLVVSENILDFSEGSSRIVKIDEEATAPIGNLQKSSIRNGWLDSFSYIETQLENASVFVNLCSEDLQETAFLEYFNDLSHHQKKCHEFLEQLAAKQDKIVPSEFFCFKKRFNEFSDQVLESLFCLVDDNHESMKACFKEIAKLSSVVGLELLEEATRTEASNTINDSLIELSIRFVHFLHFMEAVSFIIRKVDVLKVAVGEIEAAIKDAIASSPTCICSQSDVLGYITPLVQATTKLMSTRHSTDISVVKKTTSKAKNLMIDLMRTAARTTSRAIRDCAVCTARSYIKFLNQLIMLRKTKKVTENDLLSASQEVFLTLPVLSKSVRRPEGIVEILVGKTVEEIVPKNDMESEVNNLSPLPDNYNAKTSFDATNCNRRIKRKLRSDGLNSSKPEDSFVIDDSKQLPDKKSKITAPVIATPLSKACDATRGTDTADSCVARISPYNLGHYSHESHSAIQENELSADGCRLSLDLETPRIKDNSSAVSGVSNSTCDIADVPVVSGAQYEELTIPFNRVEEKINLSPASEHMAGVMQTDLKDSSGVRNGENLITKANQVANIEYSIRGADMGEKNDTQPNDSALGAGVLMDEPISAICDSTPIEVMKDVCNGKAACAISSQAVEGSLSNNGAYCEINEHNAAEFFKSTDGYNYVTKNYHMCGPTASNKALVQLESIYLHRLHTSFVAQYAKINATSNFRFYVEDIFEKDLDLRYTKLCLIALSQPNSLFRSKLKIMLQRYAFLLKRMHLSRRDDQKASLVSKYIENFKSADGELSSVGTVVKKSATRKSDRCIAPPDKRSSNRTTVTKERLYAESHRCQYVPWKPDEWAKLQDFIQNCNGTGKKGRVSEAVLCQFFEENPMVLAGMNLKKKLHKTKLKISSENLRNRKL